ncbi:MAG: signal peptidase II [Hydrogenophilales bacterium 12-61-10]|nr:MAG: signal peptidase II [Hydrogenophilales bacterium 12-61-10]
MLDFISPAMRKWLGIALLVYQEVVPVLPFFSLVLVYNTGAAFSFLADAGGWQRWFFIAIGVIATVIIVRLLRHHAGQPRMAFALALLLGGALGNVIDRVALGHVVDFLYFHYRSFAWPAFNVADSAITIGAGLLIWDSLTGKPAALDKPA